MPSPSLAGQCAIVTGGTRGIGRAITEHLLGEGVAVAICGRQADSLRAAVNALSARGKVVGLPCDVGKHEQVEQFYAFVDGQFPGVDILINNAGVGRFAPFADIEPAAWREVIDTNLSGPFYFSRLAVPRMRERGGGFIVNIGSLAGKHAFASGAAYNASKFGLVGLTEAAMLDLRYSNIRVSTIMPGSVQTEFSSGTEGADWKLDPDAVAAMCVHLLKSPQRNLASRVEMRPSKPRRK